MENYPEWLPDMLDLDGDWEIILETLYAIFTKDFKNKSPVFSGLEIWYDRRIESGDKYEEGFWHLITKTDRITGERLPEYNRAKRLPWCKPTIENTSDISVKVWNYEEGNKKIRTYLWLEHFDYVIILEKKNMRIGSIMFLITAYYVEGDTRRKLNKKYKERLL